MVETKPTEKYYRSYRSEKAVCKSLTKRGERMKAWLVRERDEFFCTVVFAESRGKARALALSTDCCEDADFTRIEVKRFPEADSQYNGRFEMDWNDPKDRLFLVKNGGFRCEYIEPDMCEDCSVKEFCEDYQQYLEDLKEEAE